VNEASNGIARIVHDDKDVVAADAITLLSGVNFSSVKKVIAAIQALSEFTGTDVQELVRLSDVPSAGVRGDDDPDNRYRATATRALCEDIALDSDFEFYDHLLKFGRLVD
jgi:hypothetical protein